MLQLPPTIRLPHPDEMAHREDIYELLARRKKARIVQGYTLQPNTTRQLPFAFMAQINVNNPALWDLFLSLAEGFPNDLSCQYALAEEEITTTDIFPKSEVLEALSRYRQELAQDGTLAFGLVYHSREMLVEILVTSFKYIRHWGQDQPFFEQRMKRAGIERQASLEFIDEYPSVVDPLKKFLPSAKRPEEVIRGLDRTFGIQRL